MQRSKFASGKPLTNGAICRMIRNHLHNELGWGDSTYPEAEIEDIEHTCPDNMDLNNLLSMKRYMQWGRSLGEANWDFDIHDFIMAHAYVLNLDISPLGDDILKQFADIKTAKDERSVIQKQIDKLEKKRMVLDDSISGMHQRLIKTKIPAGV